MPSEERSCENCMVAQIGEDAQKEHEAGRIGSKRLHAVLKEPAKKCARCWRLLFRYEPTDNWQPRED